MPASREQHDLPTTPDQLYAERIDLIKAASKTRDSRCVKSLTAATERPTGGMQGSRFFARQSKGPSKRACTPGRVVV